MEEHNNHQRSRLMLFCDSCRHSDPTTSWEPNNWQKICPYPFCPTYKNFAKRISLILIVLSLWGIIYFLAPNLASPTGQLCNMVFVVILSYIAGRLLYKLTTLPALIGMLLMGILLQNIGLVNLDGEFTKFTTQLRKIAVIIILTRAGLSLDVPTIKKMYVDILKLGFLPWIVECVAIGILSHYFLDLPWNWGFLLSSIIASVSPAVIVPCFISLKNEGYGVQKGIPTLVLAAASIDDTISIAIFGIISSIMFTQSSLTINILQGPLSIIGGIGFGVIWGYLLKFIPEKTDKHVNHLRVFMLFFGCYTAVLGADKLGFSGAGPLAIISASFVASHNWSTQGWNVKSNPVSNAFQLFWVVFEPVLFGITGAQIKLHELDAHIVTIGLGCLCCGVFIRVLATIIICFGSNFNIKEKLFIGLSWLAKATVQAALGPLALESVIENGGSEEEIQYGKTVLMICILSIVMTAPLGAFIISITGPKLLSKAISPRASDVLTQISDTRSERNREETFEHIPI